MSTHGGDDDMTTVIRAVMDGLQTFKRELDLCPDCFYYSLIANLIFRLKGEGNDEDELMTELQKMATAIYSAEPIEDRVVH